MGLESILDYSIKDAKRFLIGLVGQGPALEALVGLLSRLDFNAVFPRAKIVGWVPTPGISPEEHELEVPHLLQRQPLFRDVEAIFTARPGLMLVIDLSPDSRYMEELRQFAPPNVSLASADALLRLCLAMGDGELVSKNANALGQKEKLFGLLVDQLDSDILILDEGGTIIDANRHAAEIRGMTRIQMIGLNCNDLNGTSRFCLGEEASCPFKTSRTTAKQAQHTFAQTMDDGRVRYTHAVCIPVTDPLGGPSKYLFIRRDITEQRHLEKRLQETEKMAAIGELSTYMAHEIRNPLFSIGGFANALLRNPSLNDVAREKARIIYDESRRLDVILTSILNFARPTEQTMGVFDVDTVARQTIELMTIGGEARGIAVKLQIARNLPKVMGNAENLKQCLINMIKNALEAMPDGGTLTVRAMHSGEYVQIEVEDTGRGIPPNIQDQVFSPFFTTKNGGAGLGLAMTRKVISEMGGQVKLTSQVNKGTRISLYVPVALAVDKESEAGDREDLRNGSVLLSPQGGLH